MIACGEKREEYREMKPYWHKRLLNKEIKIICFKNGYSSNAPTMYFELKELMSGLGIIEWGAPENENVYILKLGKRVQPPSEKEE